MFSEADRDAVHLVQIAANERAERTAQDYRRFFYRRSAGAASSQKM